MEYMHVYVRTRIENEPISETGRFQFGFRHVNCCVQISGDPQRRGGLTIYRGWGAGGFQGKITNYTYVLTTVRYIFCISYEECNIASFPPLSPMVSWASDVFCISYEERKDNT